MTLRVLVVAEDQLGVTLARDLCDRVVVERGPSWLADLWHDARTRDSQRAWGGFDAADVWTEWAQTKKIADRRGLRTHGLGMEGYELAAYRAAHLAAMRTPRPDALVLCHDTDNKPVRAQMIRGIERAHVEDVPMLLAVAHREAEAWVLAGFTPRHAQEREALSSLASEIGFDPTAEPHRVTSTVQNDPRDAKRCCGRLLAEDLYAARATSCWRETPLDELVHRGASTGLPEYLAAVERVLLPVLTGTPASRA